VLPMYLRRIQRMGQREAWELWAAWRTAGWTEVSEADRLTAVLRVGGKTVRAISIRWTVYQAAIAGEPLTPGASCSWWHDKRNHTSAAGGTSQVKYPGLKSGACEE